MITLQQVDPNTPVSQGPTTINNNFTAIKEHIDDIEDLLDVNSGSLKLTALTTVPANSIEARTIILTSTVNSIVGNPDGNGVTFTLTADGDFTARRVILAGTGGNKSIIADLDITGVFTVTGATMVNAIIKFTGANSQVAWKYSTKAIVDANTGASATTPLNLAKDYIVYLDYNNGGVDLGNNSEVKLDTTNLIDGQILKLHCSRINGGGQRLWNGTSGSEIFAYINPNGAGFVSIANSVKPEFNVQATPDNQSWLLVQWTNIGGGTFRLVVLDSKNVLGVV